LVDVYQINNAAYFLALLWLHFKNLQTII